VVNSVIGQSKFWKKKVCQQIRLKVTNKAGSNLVVIEELILTSYSYRFKPIR